ncbi:MAG: hypothetical protein ACYTDW_14495 [Planctomycetota bacterium]
MAKKKRGPIATCFKDAVVPTPDQAGSWGGHEADPCGPPPTKGQINETIGPVPMGGKGKTKK